MSETEYLKGHTICWCGHERRLHWWWDKEAEEVCCDAPNCNCAEYVPASRAGNRGLEDPA